MIGLGATGARSTAEARSDVSYLLLGVIVAYLAISVVNTLVMATSQRSAEFAVLRLAGATRRQVTRMMWWESAITVSIAVVVGLAVAAAVLVPFSITLTGSPVPDVPVPQLAGVLAAAALLGTLSSVLSTSLALRVDPVHAVPLRG